MNDRKLTVADISGIDPEKNSFAMLYDSTHTNIFDEDSAFVLYATLLENSGLMKTDKWVAENASFVILANDYHDADDFLEKSQIPVIRGGGPEQMALVDAIAHSVSRKAAGNIDLKKDSFDKVYFNHLKVTLTKDPKQKTENDINHCIVDLAKFEFFQPKWGYTDNLDKAIDSDMAKLHKLEESHQQLDLFYTEDDFKRDSQQIVDHMKAAMKEFEINFRDQFRNVNINKFCQNFLQYYCHQDKNGIPCGRPTTFITRAEDDRISTRLRNAILIDAFDHIDKQKAHDIVRDHARFDMLKMTAFEHLCQFSKEPDKNIHDGMNAGIISGRTPRKGGRGR